MVHRQGCRKLVIIYFLTNHNIYILFYYLVKKLKKYCYILYTTLIFIRSYPKQYNSFESPKIMSCVVPGCKFNYTSQNESTSAFHFPRDPNLLEEWFRAIPRPRKDNGTNKQMRLSFYNFHLFVAIFTLVSLGMHSSFRRR